MRHGCYDLACAFNRLPTLHIVELLVEPRDDALRVLQQPPCLSELSSRPFALTITLLSAAPRSLQLGGDRSKIALQPSARLSVRVMVAVSMTRRF